MTMEFVTDQEIINIRLDSDLKEAGYSRLLKKALKGDYEACSEIYRMYEEGDGVLESENQCLRWFNLSMDAVLLEAGEGDTLEAAQLGDDDAQCYLAMLWEDGGIEGELEVPVSLEQALRWYSIAAELGNEEAVRHTVRLQEILDDSDGEVDDSTDDEDELTCETATAPPKVAIAAKGTQLIKQVAPPVKKQLDFAERRKDPYKILRMATKGGHLMVLGGLLPIRGSIGADLEYFRDGSVPQRTGNLGKKSKYQTDGNLQVFFLKPEAVDKYIFIGKLVDLYNKF